VLQTHARLLGRQEPRPGLRPLDEDDGVLEILLQVSPLGMRHTIEPIEVEVRDVNPPRVAVADRVGGAGDGPLDAKRSSGPPHEGRLAGAELPLHEDDVTRSKAHSQPRGDALGLLR
jgi:hypothetical protein